MGTAHPVGKNIFQVGESKWSGIVKTGSVVDGVGDSGKSPATDRKAAS